MRRRAGKYGTQCHNFMVRKRKLDRDLTEIMDPLFVMKGKVCAAPERGLKVRIVSKHHHAVQMPAHALRRYLFRGLRRDPRTSSVMAGKGQEKIKDLLDGKRKGFGLQLLSSDLTSASDLLPLELIQAIG